MGLRVLKLLGSVYNNYNEKKQRDLPEVLSELETVFRDTEQPANRVTEET